jgi:hypothetical protein
MLHQIQYRFKNKPTANDLLWARCAWVLGYQLSDVQFEPLSWFDDSTAEAVQTGYIGRAGIVDAYGAPDLSLCDYDQAEPVSWLFLARIARMIGSKIESVCYRKTVRGWHVIIHWNRRFKPIELVALQAVLGSDGQREAYNLARVLSGKARNRRWNLLFEEKLT